MKEWKGPHKEQQTKEKKGKKAVKRSVPTKDEVMGLIARYSWSHLERAEEAVEESGAPLETWLDDRAEDVADEVQIELEGKYPYLEELNREAINKQLWNIAYRFMCEESGI